MITWSGTESLDDFEKKILEIITPFMVAEDPAIQRPGSTKSNPDGELWIKFHPVICMIPSTVHVKLKKLAADKDMPKYLEDIAMLAKFAEGERRKGFGKRAEQWNDKRINKIEVIIKALGLWEAREQAMAESLASD